MTWGNFRIKDYRVRTMDSHVHSVHRYRRSMPRIPTSSDFIRLWWKGRVRAGCQLTNLEEYRPSYDYRGAPHWFRHVAMKAMYEDFLKFHPGLTTPLVFSNHLCQIVCHFDMVTLPGRLNTKDGGMFLRPARRFMRFEPIEIYRRSNENQTESEQERT